MTSAVTKLFPLDREDGPSPVSPVVPAPAAAEIQISKNETERKKKKKKKTTHVCAFMFVNCVRACVCACAYDVKVSAIIGCVQLYYNFGLSLPSADFFCGGL